MITEIILTIFASCYYLFCALAFATYIQEVNKKENSIILLAKVLWIVVISPIAVPIMLGIMLGSKLKN